MGRDVLSDLCPPRVPSRVPYHRHTAVYLSILLLRNLRIGIVVESLVRYEDERSTNQK